MGGITHKTWNTHSTYDCKTYNLQKPVTLQLNKARDQTTITYITTDLGLY